jgi:hypothetical protein
MHGSGSAHDIHGPQYLLPQYADSGQNLDLHHQPDLMSVDFVSFSSTSLPLAGSSESHLLGAASDAGRLRPRRRHAGNPKIDLEPYKEDIHRMYMEKGSTMDELIRAMVALHGIKAKAS